MIGELTAAIGQVLESPSALVQTGLGLVLLLFGRRLFWLLIALLGFAVGVYVAETYLSVEPAWRLAVGLGLGLLGGFGAVFLQKVAIAVGGALVAAYATWWYLSLGAEELVAWQWLVVVVAGALGVAIARVVVDLALVGVSCLAGATLALQGLELEPSLSRWLFIGLLAVGAAVQLGGMRSSASAEG